MSYDDLDLSFERKEKLVQQAKELVKFGVPSLHWFTYSDPSQVVEIAKAVY